jgi:hypothetical protein
MAQNKKALRVKKIAAQAAKKLEKLVGDDVSELRDQFFSFTDKDYDSEIEEEFFQVMSLLEAGERVLVEVLNQMYKMGGIKR